MNWHRWLATLFVVLALAACAQGGQAPYAPYSHEDRNDRGVVACSGWGYSDLARRALNPRGVGHAGTVAALADLMSISTR
jgi:hypothetical protein